jgi:UDP-N-acetylglucosamine 4,6-dehydratase
VRDALAKNAARVVAVARNAEMRYRLQQEYRDDRRLVVVPGDVRIVGDLRRAFDVAGIVDVVVHAAAEKHIVTGQDHRAYTRDVNVGGAESLIEVAAHRRAGKVVALSTDKACEPVNYYGETKAEAERLFVAANHTIVRYGNVVGSSGSVIPLFLKQRSAGLITITDMRMTRFFMPISDDGGWQVVQEPGRQPVMSAVGLVKYAIKRGCGGDILIPSIPSGSIADLARQLGPTCVIRETGIRDGEKLHEQLIAADEVERTYRLTQGVYAVLPAPVKHLTPVEPTFRHASDVDPQPLVIDECAV